MAEVTERDYKKSDRENASHLSRTVLFMTGSVGDISQVPRVMVIGTETADKLRVAIAFGRTQKIMRQSARCTFGFRVMVIGPFLVYYRTPWPSTVPNYYQFINTASASIKRSPSIDCRCFT